MPRKTDGVLFELQPRPTKGEDGKPLLYAQPVVEYKYDLDAIDDFCCKYRHTSKGEMKHFFSLLEEVTTMWLRQGDHPRCTVIVTVAYGTTYLSKTLPLCKTGSQRPL